MGKFMILDVSKAGHEGRDWLEYGHDLIAYVTDVTQHGKYFAEIGQLHFALPSSCFRELPPSMVIDGVIQKIEIVDWRDAQADDA